MSPATTLEAKVEYLLRRDEEAQKNMNTLVQRLAELERDSVRRLEGLRAAMEQRFDERLTEKFDEYRQARVAGAFALGLGLVLATVANLL